MYIVSTGVFILLFASLAACSCPKEGIHHLGSCKYKIRCIGTINGAWLEPECQGPSNNDVIVDVTLENAVNGFHVNVANVDFLMSITSLTVLGSWAQANLTFLESTLRLQHLYLVNMQIKRIHGSPFHFLSRLEELDLSHNELTEIDELFVFAYENKIKKLRLSFNKIKDIPGYVFQELTSLTELDLSNNYIKDLNEEPFSNLTNLETLILNNNNIQYLNGAINMKLLNLKHLSLNNNEIDFIDDKLLDKIYHLKTFEISNNKLVDLDPKLLFRHWGHFNNHGICRMVYSKNDFSIILNATSEELMKKINKNQIDILTHVDLSSNKISQVEYNAFHSTINMISLDISNNELSEFVVNSEDLASIKFLNISSNRIKNLDFQTFSLMRYLQNLDLSNNQFEYAPDGSLIHSSNLKRLNITDNDIQQVVDFRVTFHAEGGVLDLSENSLSSFNILPGEAKGLIELILHSNRISDPTKIVLKHHRNLTKLDMSENFITALNETSLQLPVTLIYLDLTSNKMKHIKPSAFHGVKNLRILRLSHNYLTQIEYGVFQGLTSLLNLDLSYNRINYLDSNVLSDLKFLRFLSIRHNNMTNLECNAWLSHGNDLTVYIDGNNLSCVWLSTVLSNYNNGYSKMHPAAIVSPVGMHSLDGIPCEQGPGDLFNARSKYVMLDERLLVINQKILEAVQQQTAYLRKYIWRSILQEANRTIHQD